MDSTNRSSVASPVLRLRSRAVARLAARCVLSSVSLAAALLVAAGCTTTPKRNLKPAPYIDVVAAEQRDDIYAIRQLWPQYPWLQDADRTVTGFRVPTYFVSSETEKGAFVPGVIFAWLYEIERRPDGGTERKLRHMWQLDRDQAMGFRVRKLVVLGHPYMLMLFWPREVDVVGKTIEIEFGYERTDGKLIMATTRRFRVPARPGMRSAGVTRSTARQNTRRPPTSQPPKIASEPRAAASRPD